ncbi:fimbrial protein [Burkholderia territorii]|nr:fimbrial protein [Burkholderia territorii]MBM2775110.1 type 1 fimbrial protein [Burkholderia territorii]VWB23546.1 fimbria adhesin protein [Burkholderia territorii]
MKRLINYFCLIPLVAILWSPSIANAAFCFGLPGFSTNVINFPGKTINPDRNAAVGTVLDTITVFLPTRWSNVVQCNTPQVAMAVTHNGNLTSLGNYIYQTNAPGIGIRIKTVVDGPAWANGNSRGQTYYEDLDNGATLTSDPANFWGPFQWIAYGGTFTLEIIKTGEIQPGKVFSAEIGEVVAGGVVFRRFNLSGDVVVQYASCKVMSSSIRVPLGSVPQRKFTGPGSTSDPVNFSIPIDCTGVTRNVYMTFTDNTNPGNTGNVLPLTRDSTARGIGIQILPDSATGVSYPIAFGPESGAINQQLVATLGRQSDIGRVDVKLRARYVQTDARVVPGTANGILTYMLSYQ